MDMRVRPDGVRLSLSVLEKFLRRRNWTVSQLADPRTGLLLARAESPEGQALTYPDPRILFHDRDRAADLDAALDALAALIGEPRPGLDALVLERFDAQPPGFACTGCGDCCSKLGDASRGRVCPEEVEAWSEAGLSRVLRFVCREERKGYAFFRAWVHPQTGEYLRRCPWLRRDAAAGRSACAIHAHRPLKCRSFPLNAEQASRLECPGTPGEG